MSERSAVTGVLIAEALAHGDMGLAAALLAPGGVATALARWGDADQQATYLPAFIGDDVPAAALALLEPRPAVRPVRAPDDGPRRPATATCSSGEKSLVPRAATRGAVPRGGAARGRGPALFVVESGTDGVERRARARDGRARRRHRRG